MKKVSICIPVYNNIQGVKRLLDSVAIQTFRDFEVIITDDSEDHGVEAVLPTYKELDIRYYKNEKRLGATGNWNHAIQKSTGEFIKIMHHDDWFSDKDSLGKFVSLLEQNSQAVLAFSGTWQVGEKQRYSRHISPGDAQMIEDDYRNLYLGNTIGAPSAVIHRRSTCQYDDNLTWLVDMDFYMQLLKNKQPFVYTEEPLISIGMGNEQLTQKCIANQAINCFEYKYLYKKYNLGDVQVYQDKLVQIYLTYKGSVRELKELGISIPFYRRQQVRKFLCKVKTKLEITIKKGNA